MFNNALSFLRFRSDESYLVIDYCQRALLTVSSGDIVTGLPAKEMQTIGKNLIIMTLLENHEGKTIEMVSKGGQSGFKRNRYMSNGFFPLSNADS